MPTAQLYTAAALLSGLAITIVLAAYLTPRTWWRRLNARALLILLVGAGSFGSLLLTAAHHLPAIASANALASSEAGTGAGSADVSATTPTRMPTAVATVAKVASAPAAILIAGQPFAVYRDLNVRAAAGVQAARLLTVPAGALITPTGARQGDWWQITANVAGRESTGWVNSLWLRRRGE